MKGSVGCGVRTRGLDLEMAGGSEAVGEGRMSFGGDQRWGGLLGVGMETEWDADQRDTWRGLRARGGSAEARL